jgi:hypothetical protein
MLIRKNGRVALQLVQTVLLFVLFPIFATVPVSAQSGSVDAAIGHSVVILTGPWRFHPGDDPAFAKPNLDDSSWGLLDLTPPEGSFDPVTGNSGFVPGWTAHGFPKLTGYAWYRLHVHVRNKTSDTGAERLAISMPLDFDDAYQVYVNGRLVGGFGLFNPNSVVFYNSQPCSFLLADTMGTGDLTIAIRTWMDAGTPLLTQDAGGLHGPPLLGEASAIDAMLRLNWDQVNRSQIGSVVAIAFLCLATMLGFVLYWLDRSEPAYLWLGVVCAATLVVRSSVVVIYYFTITPMTAQEVFQDVIMGPVTLGLWALFWARWFNLQGFRKIARVTWVLTALLVIGMSTVRPPLFGTLIPVHASAWLIPVTVTLKLSLGVVLLWVTYQGIRKGTAEGWLALAPILLTIAWAYQQELAVLHVPATVRIYGLTITWGTIANLFMLAIISILMMRRFIRSQRESVLLRLEIEQARQVQQVLIPEAIPAIPGFSVETEYRPARQVGGDFFQVLPTPNGGVLAIVGDVSGKGTPAAMAVSLLVGAIRTLARSTDSPGEILGVLNERMIGRSNGGFTTCLALRIDPDGTLRLANAGHLPPYLNGKELETSPALPLGLAEGAYAEAQFRLDENDRLTLVTDGVIEARNKAGELFGFARTAAIARASAGSIAERAQEFGQNDDITVLTITRLAAKLKPSALGEVLLPATSPATN